MKPILAIAVVFLCLLGAGCDSDSPSAVDGGPQMFSGSVEFEGESLHFFSVSSQGGFRFELVELRAEPVSDDDPLTLSLGFGFGRPLEDGTCDVSYTTGFNEGSSVSLGLTERDYCIRMFDNGLIAEDSSRVYLLTVNASS